MPANYLLLEEDEPYYKASEQSLFLVDGDNDDVFPTPMASGAAPQAPYSNEKILSPHLVRKPSDTYMHAHAQGVQKGGATRM
jgi:hypothetical protein